MRLVLHGGELLSTHSFITLSIRLSLAYVNKPLDFCFTFDTVIIKMLLKFISEYLDFENLTKQALDQLYSSIVFFLF